MTNGTTPAPLGDDRTGQRFAIVLTIAFAAVVAIGMAFHEPWRDEWQAWLLARDSPSLKALLYNMRYEGHPPTWHVVLFALSRVTRSVVALQALQLVLATAAVWLLARHSPFSRLQKALIAFGYYPAYEYGVISRSYSLGTLALFAACIAWTVRRRSYLPVALALSFLAFTNVYGVIIALAFCCAILVELAFDAELRASVRQRAARMAFSAALLGAAMTVSVQFMKPPQDAGFEGRSATTAASSTESDAAVVVAFIPVRAFLPFPRFADGVPVWGETAVVDGPGVPNSPLLGFALVGAFLLLTMRRVGAATLLVAGGAGLLLFAWMFHYGYLRHHGQLMLLVIASAWLAGLPGAAPPRVPQSLLNRASRIGAVVFTLVLAVHTAAFATLYGFDLRLPFTEGEESARLLADAGARQGVPVLATHGSYGTTLAGYLDTPVYLMDQDALGTFIVWGEGRDHVPPDSIVPRAVRRIPEGGTAVLLATDRHFNRDVPGVRVEPLTHGRRPHLAPEIFDLYRITREAGAPADSVPAPGR